MQKDKLVLVTDPEIIAAIERNGFGDPVPVEKNEQGYWVYQWSLEHYKAAHDEHSSSAGEVDS